MGFYGGGGGGSSPDPNIGIAQRQLADLAIRQQNYFESNFAPRMMQQMDEQIALGRRQVDMQEELQGFELDEARRFSDRYWGTQAPLEDELIAKARAYNESAEQERMAGVAGADVAQAFAQSREQMQRGLQRRGVSPGSGAAMSEYRKMAMDEALAKAGAMNQTREAARQLGWTRLGEAAALGRGLPSFGATSAQIAAGAGANAVAAGGSALGAVNSTAGASTANASAIGNMWNAVGNLGVQSDRNRFAAMNNEAAGWGALIGGIGGLMQGFAAMSSKKLKTRGENVDGGEVLDGINRLDNETWRYKRGVEDSGEHVGPYAEDVRREFGDHVAPGGKAIDLSKMNALNRRAIQTLSKRVQQLEAELKAIA